MNVRSLGFVAWRRVWWIVYVLMRIVLRASIGREKRDKLLRQLGLHYSYGFNTAHYISFGLSNLAWEPLFYRVFRKVFRRSGRILIDCGAHIGLYSSFTARMLNRVTNARVIALEPDPDNFTVLERETACWSHLVKPLPLALWLSDDEQVVFHRGGGKHSMDGSIVPSETHQRTGNLFGETIMVKTVRLDTLIKREGFETVDLVKMDVQGAELPILCDPTLDLSKVKNMIVEVHYNYLSEESRKILSSLMKNGFRVVPLYPDNKANSYHLLAAKGEVPW